MTCEWRDQLDRYVDGEMPEAEIARMDAHLRSCASCAADALGRMRTKRSIHASAANAYVPSAEFRARVSKEVSVSRKRALPWLPQLAFAAALIAFVAVGIAVWQRHSPRQDVFASSSPAQRLNFNFETWSDHGLRYVVISDAARGDVQTLSNLLHNAAQ